MVTAQTFDAPGQAFSVAVSPYDDSALNLKLKTDFEAALAERWQARMIEEAADALLLLFEYEVVPADMAPHDRKSVEEGKGVEVRFNLGGWRHNKKKREKK